MYRAAVANKTVRRAQLGRTLPSPRNSARKLLGISPVKKIRRD